jgi:HEAT repeat protein
MDSVMLRTLLIAVILLCLATVASGDIVLLKSGARFEGTVLQDDENGVELQTGTGVLTFSRAQVQRVLYRRLPERNEPADPAPANDPDPADPEDPETPIEPGELHEWNLPTERVLSVLDILDEVRRGGAVPEEQFIGKLLGQGMDQFDVMFLVLAEQLSDPRKTAEGTAREPYRLVNRQRRVLVDAIVRLYSADTLKKWDRFLYTPTPDPVRVRAIHLLAHVGDAAALKRILSVLNSIDDDVLIEAAELRGAFVQAIAGLLQKDSAGFVHVLEAWEHFSPAEFRILIDAVRGSESPAAIPLLVRLLGQSEKTDPLLLERIRLVGGACSRDTRESALTVVRPLSASGPAATRVAAIRVMAALDDLSSVDALIAMLEDKEGRVGAAASQALQTLSGTILGETTEAWTRWKESEQEWYEVDADALLDSLESPQPGDVIGALRVLATHRLYRNELIPEIAPSIDHPSPQVRRLTCTTLVALGSDAILPTLLLGLEDEEESVVEEAHRGLEKITGNRTIPDDPEAWKAYLQGRQ